MFLPKNVTLVAVCEIRGVFVSAAAINQTETKWAICNTPSRWSSPDITEPGESAGELGTDPKISWRIGSKEHNCNHF